MRLQLRLGNGKLLSSQRTRGAFVFALVAALMVGGPRAFAAEVPVPEGYRLVSSEEVAPGLDHLLLEKEKPRRVVHIARMSTSSALRLGVVVSGNAVAGPPPTLERTSSMCVRVDCLVAVNGDFYNLTTGEPIGGVISQGEMVRSPNSHHHQLAIAAGAFNARTIDWTARLVPTDLRELSINGVNVERGENQIVLYTPAFGPSTETNRFGNEIVAEVLRPEQSIRIGQTTLLRIIEIRQGSGDSAIPRGGAVLSGHGAGAEALADLWSRVQAGAAAQELLLRIESIPEAMESLGGTPILVREGKRWFKDDDAAFIRDAHPRTMAGWTSGGDLYLVTVDGRQSGYSDGMTLGEAADLMIALGATEAINLDGGGSTTFVVRGSVVNRPSDRAVRRGGHEMIVNIPQRGDALIGNVERPVAVALVILRGPAQPGQGSGDVPEGALAEIRLPSSTRILAAPVPWAADPGSNPGAGLPALVGEPNPQDFALKILALGLNLAVALGLFASFRRVHREAAQR